MPVNKEQLMEATRSLQKEWAYLEPLQLPVDTLRGRSTVYVREVEDSAGKTTAYVKIYAYRRLPFRSTSRRPKSQTEVHNLLFFRSIGIPTPRVIAWGVQGGGLGRTARDFIITEAEADTERLDKFVPLHCANPEQPDQLAARRHIARKLGEWTARMHAEGFIHEDLKWRNILARPSGGQPELFWIDCPKGHFAGSGQSFTRKKLKDCAALDKIARFECSKEERSAFIQAYLGESASKQAMAEMCRRVENYRRKRFDPKDDRQREHAKKDQ